MVGIGLATPGPLFRHEGRIALMTNFPGWERIALRKEFAGAFGLPTFIEHDANAAALAEWWFGPNLQAAETMVYIAAGQGIGCGIIVDGLLHRGALGIAGEIGHASIDCNGLHCQCDNRGCLELYCSTTALLRDVAKDLVVHPESRLAKATRLSAEEVVNLAGQGDGLAQRAIQRAAHYLGVGVVNLVNTIHPHRVVIGDELAQAGPLLLQEVRRIVQERTLPAVAQAVKIELSSFATDPVLVGASALAIEYVLNTPSNLLKLAR